MKTRIIVLTLVFILLLTPFALAGVDKAVVKSIDFERQGEETLVRITVELYSNGEGEAYLEAIANYDGKDYTTMPLRMPCSFPYQTFTFLLRKSDFRRVDFTQGIEQELPELVEEKNVVVYVYGKKITSPEDRGTEDVKSELARRGYALREVLAKGTKTLKWGSKK